MTPTTSSWSRTLLQRSLLSSLRHSRPVRLGVGRTPRCSVPRMSSGSARRRGTGTAPSRPSWTTSTKRSPGTARPMRNGPSAEQKAQKELQKKRSWEKKKEEARELRDLIAKKDEEWEAKLAAEREERQKALALVDLERRHAALQNYLAQRMLDAGEMIAPQLRQLVGGNSEEEIDAKINELVEISGSILGDTQQMIAQTNAARPTVGVTAPPIGPSDMTATTRTYTPDDLKALTPEEYADRRDSLLRAASQSRRQ